MDPYRMSGAAKRALAAAEKEALALGHLRLESVHVVLGLLAERGAAQVALARRGLKTERLRAEADRLYEGPRGARARDLDRTSGELPEVLELARDGADVAGDNDIAPVRLFLAATEGDELAAAVALRALGVDVEAARREAEALARDEAQGSLPD